MSLTKAAINSSRVTLVFLICILFGGYSYFQRAPKAEDPGFTIKIAQIRTYFPGASPERVNQLVTDKIEKRIQEMPEVRFIRSRSKSGLSIVEAEIHPTFRGAETRPVWDKLRRKVDDAKQDLPDGIQGPFVNDEFGDVFGVVIGLTGDGYDYRELKDIADDVRDDLLTLPEAAKVEIYGAQDQRVFVEFSTEKLAKMGLSPDQFAAVLNSQNIVAGGGSIEREGKRYILEPTGNYESVADIAATLIRLPGSKESVPLGSIADISRGYVDPPTSFFHESGLPGLGLAVSMRQGGNILLLGEQVRGKMREMDETYPHGVNFNIVNFQPDDVDVTISGFTTSLVQAIVVVLISMLIFLGLRTGLVVAALIPLAMAATMIFMSVGGMGLDKVSLAALVIALGLLVDNGVVMCESALVRMESGDSPVKAAVDSANELKIPLFISSLTTIAAFLPLPLAANDMGEFMGPLAIILAVTLLASWLLSITAIPWLCSLFLRVEKKDASKPTPVPFETRFYQIYRAILTWLLKNRAIALIAVALMFASSVKVLAIVPKIFMSDSNLSSFTVELTGDRGTDLRHTQRVVQEIESWLRDTYQVTEEEAAAGKEGLVKWATYIGNGGPRFYLSFSPEDPSPEYAIIIPTATSGDEAARLVPQIRDYVTENYPDLDAVVKLRASGGAPKSPIGYEISGKDRTEVFRLVGEVKKKLGVIPGVVNIRDDWGQKTKKIIVDIDDGRLKRVGMTNRDVATSLTATFDGFPATQFREGDELIPTLIRAKASSNDEQARRVGALSVFSAESGKSVPLGQVANLDVVFEPPMIARKNRMTTVEVRANITSSITASAVNTQILPWLKEDSKTWPAGFRFHVTGEAEKSADATSAIGANLPLAAFFIVMLLVLQFNSIRQSIIVITTIPLSLIGLTYGLWLANSYFGFMALLGLLSLAGIVVNNAIVLIDRFRIEEEQGATRQQAIINSAQQRLRPILLTTATTMTGLLPLWFGDDPMWVPMAIAIFCGLAFATVLTLGLVPILYSVFYKASFTGFSYKPPEPTPTVAS